MSTSTTDPSDESDVITVELIDSKALQMHFEVEKADALHQIFNKYSHFKGVSMDTLQFTFNDKEVINSTDTPSSLGMTTNNCTVQVSLTGEELTKEQIANACISNSIPTATDLLTNNKKLCHEKISWLDSDGEECNTPPIFIAIDYRHAELVEQLLSLHDKNVLNTLTGGDTGYNALQWASWTGNLEIVKILVEKGGATADEEAISLARDDNHNDVVDYLLDHVDVYANLQGDTDEIMTKACREGDAVMVRKLLEEDNYDVDKWKDDDGKYLAFSPMYLAVKHCNMDVIQIFAEKGVQLD